MILRQSYKLKRMVENMIKHVHACLEVKEGPFKHILSLRITKYVFRISFYFFLNSTSDFLDTLTAMRHVQIAIIKNLIEAIF